MFYYSLFWQWSETLNNVLINIMIYISFVLLQVKFLETFYLTSYPTERNFINHLNRATRYNIKSINPHIITHHSWTALSWISVMFCSGSSNMYATTLIAMIVMVCDVNAYYPAFTITYPEISLFPGQCKGTSLPAIVAKQVWMGCECKLLNGLL